MQKRLLSALVFSCLLGLALSVPKLCNLYTRYRALVRWHRPRANVRYLEWGPGSTTPEFRAVMRAFGLKNGDPVAKFIEILGPPDSVSDGWGEGVKRYRWKDSEYFWPTPRNPLDYMVREKLAEARVAATREGRGQDD